MRRVLGRPVDEQTRCVHYRTPLDVIAIKFWCCQAYYPCHLCHEETAGHIAIELGTLQIQGGLITHPQSMWKYIDGFN